MIPALDGRYLIVWTRAFERRIALATRVVWGFELQLYLDCGWRLIAEDPEPDRYALWRKAEDDCA